MLLLGLDPYLKLVIAVDEDVNVFDEQEVLWTLATRFQADTDMFMVPHAFCNRLDPSSRDGMSAKLALDATAPLRWDVERTSVPRSAVDWATALLEQNLHMKPQR
jgi:3-polyprenyl-4-hydroxybenzoate decarboxylase